MSSETASKSEVTNAPKGATTTVDLVIRLQVVGALVDVAWYRAALEALAEVMAVQAEEGLWSLGYAEAETEGGESTLVAEIDSTRVHAVLIEGADELTKGDV